jgi:site-specific DNA-methyltransferase (adenine-specific)
VFTKNFSPQVLKANMRVVGNCEYAIMLYRAKLPKFNNHGKMIFNAMEWPRDNDSEKIHPTQKPVQLLQRLITIFTDPGDVVIDPVCGSGSTVIAAHRCDRSGYGFEIKKDFHRAACQWLEREKSQMTMKF